MQNFGDERETARQAVEAVGMRPVMAEDFAARSQTPKDACLEGVRASDVYVGIAGERYGWVTPAGVSATEEEFDAARLRGLPILWFVKRCEMEARQREFVKRIQDYESGYFRAAFTDRSDLAIAVAKALSGLRAADVRSLTPADAQARVMALFGRRDDRGWYRSSGDCVLAAVAFPERLGPELISPVELGKPEFKQRLTKAALFGEGTVFDTRYATRHEDERDALAVTQHDGRDRNLRVLRFQPDGTVAWRHLLGQDRPRDIGGFASMIIDQDEVQTVLGQFLAFLSAFYREHAGPARCPAIYVSMALFGTGHRLFGRIPSPAPNSLSLGFGVMEDPLVVPASPMRMSLGQLADSTEVARDFVGRMERIFRAENACFDH